MKRALITLAALLTLAFAGTAVAQSSSALLPSVFAGWTRTSAGHVVKDASLADPTNADVLKENGFTDLEEATYTRPGRKITVKAARFKDASGAYSAFTIYKEPDMATLDMGGRPGERLGASIGDRVLFYKENILVQVTLDKITAMTAGEMRELAASLPDVKGPAQNLPILPTYLPKQNYVKNSAKYVVGPAGLSHIGSPLPESVVGFDKGAEVVEGKYDTRQGTATLMLISYPTPAIAGERLREIEALNQNPPVAGNSDLAGPFAVKRTGPIVVLTAGRISPDNAKALLAQVNYDADVTWNENTSFNKKDNVANLLVNIVILCGILILLSLGFGVAFGGVRLLLKKLIPGRLFDRPDDIEIIQLRIGTRR